MTELISIAESLKPIWILERLTLQVSEFVMAWKQFWTKNVVPFSPFGDLPTVNSSMIRCLPEQLQSFSLRDYASVYQKHRNCPELEDRFKKQTEISSFNRALRKGKLTPELKLELRKRYVARQYVLSQQLTPSMEELRRQENHLLSAQPSSTQIAIFVENGGMKQMKAHATEEAITLQFWDSDACLDRNRQVDRQHAVVALPYCDIFITSDRDLQKRCVKLRDALDFPIADVMTAAEFFRDWRNWTTQL